MSKFKKWWSQIKTNKEVADTVIEVFEGIAVEAWQEAVEEAIKIAKENCPSFCPTVQKIREELLDE